MKKLLCFFLISCMLFCFSACSKESLTEERIQSIVQDELRKVTESTEDENNSTFGTPEDDYTKYFNFVLVDGKYCALSVKSNIEIPEVLVVPNQYNGIEVAYTGAELIDGLPVKTIIFEAGVECSYFLCGEGNNCPSLETIVFLSENPADCIEGKLRLAKDMPLQLNNAQINGNCKIFVPDNSIDSYKDCWSWGYDSIMHPLSKLDTSIAQYVQ